MQDKDLDRFAQVLAGLGDLFDKRINKMTIEIYWAALKQYGLADIERAVTSIVSTKKFNKFPLPAEFIDYINPADDLDARAAIATNEFLDRLADSGYHSFAFKDPVIALVVEHQGGWHFVCQTFPKYADQAEDQKWWLKDFEKLYRIYARQPLPLKIPRIVGCLEAENRAKGYICQANGEFMLGLNAKGETVPLLENSEEGRKYLETQKTMLLEHKSETKAEVNNA